MEKFSELSEKETFFLIIKSWKLISLTILITLGIMISVFSVYNPKEYTRTLVLEGIYSSSYYTVYGEYKNTYKNETEMLSILTSSEFTEFVISNSATTKIYSFTLTPVGDFYELSIMSRDEDITEVYADLVEQYANQFVQYKLTESSTSSYIDLYTKKNNDLNAQINAYISLKYHYTEIIDTMIKNKMNTSSEISLNGYQKRLEEINLELIEIQFQSEENNTRLNTLNSMNQLTSNFLEYSKKNSSDFPEFAHLVQIKKESELIIQPLFKNEVIYLMGVSIGLSLGIFLTFLRLFLINKNNRFF